MKGSRGDVYREEGRRVKGSRRDEVREEGDMRRAVGDMYERR